MTKEQVELLKIPISDDVSVLYVESALQWVLDNTILEFDINNDDDLRALPANVRLFVVKFKELMSTNEGVTSESIEGLSQSFNTNDKSGLIWQLAESLIDKLLKSDVTFISAQNRWE